MVFCNIKSLILLAHMTVVTILILIDGFLQLRVKDGEIRLLFSHNPYFNRWFSAIWIIHDIQ